MMREVAVKLPGTVLLGSAIVLAWEIGHGRAPAWWAFVGVALITAGAFLDALLERRR